MRWLNRSSHTCVVCTRENSRKSYQADPEAVKKRTKEYKKTRSEFFKEYQKQYRQEHKKQCSEYSLKYYRKNLDKVKARILRHKQANRESILERNRIRDRKRYQTQERKEYHKQQTREYRRRFPESVKVMHNRRRTRLKKVHKSFYTATELKSRLELFKDVCCYCGKKLDGKGTVDHFIPIAAGGSDVLGNLVLCCQSCNSSKQDTDVLVWLKRQSFYSPKRWNQLLKLLRASESTLNQLPLF